MMRLPAVADQFYPGDARTLHRTLEALVPAIPEADKGEALAVVSPHAGYIYSGQVAGETFAGVKIPGHVIVMGPNHHGVGAPVALMAEGSWRMPGGDVPIATDLAALLLAASDLIVSDATAHRYEHSLEVQVPFLQYCGGDFALAPLVLSSLSYADCKILGQAIVRAIRSFGKPVLLVASTDMTHYESREEASRKDEQAMAHVRNLDPEGLYHTVLGRRITMCGIIPTTVALVAALELGARTARLVRYTDSGETSGDVDQVVGYAGFVIA